MEEWSKGYGGQVPFFCVLSLALARARLAVDSVKCVNGPMGRYAGARGSKCALSAVGKVGRVARWMCERGCVGRGWLADMAQRGW